MMVIQWPPATVGCGGQRGAGGCGGDGVSARRSSQCWDAFGTNWTGGTRTHDRTTDTGNGALSISFSLSISLTHAHTTIHTMHPPPYPRTLIRPPHTRTKSSYTPPSPLYPSTPRASLPPTSLTFREKKGKHEQLVAPSSSSSSSSVKRRWASLVVACRASPPADAARDFIEFIARPAAILALICAQPTPPRLVHF